MRHALTRAFGVALVFLALLCPRRGEGADVRPVVRVVLAASPDVPPWFDGFVKHLERELALRGIDVVVSRGGRTGAMPRDTRGPSAAPDAELVVEAPAQLRPVLRFSAPPRGEPSAAEGNGAGRVRQIDLAGVPADGCALALAVAADELMRSNWPRAVSADAARSAGTEGAARGAEDAAPSAAAPAKANADARRSTSVPTEKEPPKESVREPKLGSAAAPRVTSEPSDTGGAESEQGSAAPRTGAGWRSNIAVAAAGEAFVGGQLQLGTDLRWDVQVLPRLGLELSGGWRRILRQQTTHGSIDGRAWVAGGAIGVIALGNARTNLSFLGRAFLVRVTYDGDPRDGTIDVTGGSAFGLVLAAGPSVRHALSRSFGLQAELLAGASPLATSATDDGQVVFATNGAAFLGSIGLSLGL